MFSIFLNNTNLRIFLFSLWFVYLSSYCHFFSKSLEFFYHVLSNYIVFEKHTGYLLKHLEDQSRIFKHKISNVSSTRINRSPASKPVAVHLKDQSFAILKTSSGSSEKINRSSTSKPVAVHLKDQSLVLVSICVALCTIFYPTITFLTLEVVQWRNTDSSSWMRDKASLSWYYSYLDHK